MGGLDKNNYAHNDTMILEHGSWVVGPSLTSPRVGACAVTLNSGEVILTGGARNGAMASVELFSFNLLTWTSLCPMKRPRSQHSCSHVWIGGNGQISVNVKDNSVSTVIVAGGSVVIPVVVDVLLYLL